MSDIDRSILDSLRDFDVERTGAQVRFRGTMMFAPALVGPPGRVHGGIHPLVRTLPILARLQGAERRRQRIRLDASLQKALPLETLVPFEGTYAEGGAGYRLETRFLDTDRLLATASDPPAGALLGGPELARFRDVFEASQAGPAFPLRVLGVTYQITGAAVTLDLASLGAHAHAHEHALDPASHLHRCLLDDGALGLTALCTQLDAVGATARGALMRHPQFTRHITLSFDLEGLTAGAPLLLLADRTTIEEDTSPDAPTVEVKGKRYGSARVEVVAADPSFSRCYAHGFVQIHPVDPSRYQGFDGMRKLREA
jgi:hypothetical protein